MWVRLGLQRLAPVDDAPARATLWARRSREQRLMKHSAPAAEAMSPGVEGYRPMDTDTRTAAAAYALGDRLGTTDVATSRITRTGQDFTERRIFRVTVSTSALASDLDPRSDTTGTEDIGILDTSISLTVTHTTHTAIGRGS